MPPRRPLRTPSPLAALLCCLLLSACSSTQGPGLPSLPKVPDLPSVPAMATVKPTARDAAVTERVGQAAITPLSDLNVVQEEIPESLRHAQQGPYNLPDQPGCVPIQAEIDALDEALGADIDSSGKGKPSLMERGTDLAENYGVGVLRRTVEGFVPFRSWVRKLSGAEKHSKQVAAAITAGGVRRAYLKGMRQGMNCPIPPQPTPTVALTAAAAPQAASAASAASAAVTPAPTPAGSP